MKKILVLYYSMYGHVERLAEAVAEGARRVPGVEVSVKRVPETMPEEIARKAGAKLDQAAPTASPQELGDYDAIDRKSTRLNSSHVKISYAVFCLKKKKNKKNELQQRKKRHKV